MGNGMSNKVVDPDLLAQLNASSAGNKVTDPNIISQLNGSSAEAQQPSFAGQMGSNLKQGASDLVDLGTLSGYKDMNTLPAYQNLKEKHQAGTATRQDYLEAFFEGAQNSPAGKALSALNIHPGINAASTAIGNYVNPAIEQATGGSKEDAQAVEMVLPFLFKGAKQVAPETIDAIGTAGKKIINSPITEPIKQTAGRLLSPKLTPEDTQLLPVAEKYNFPVLRSQMGDGDIAPAIQESVSRAPFSGMSKVVKEQQAALNKGAAESFGETATRITPDVINRAYTKIGAEYDNLFKGTKLKVSDENVQKILDTEDLATEEVGAMPPILKNNIQKLLNGVDDNGIIKGELLNNVRKDLTGFTRRQSQHVAAPYVRQLVDTITQIAEDSGNKGLREANRKYRNLKTVSKDVTKNNGDINPTRLQNSVMKNFPDYEKGGGGDLGDLARISTRYMAKVPKTEIGAVPQVISGGLGITGIAKGITALNKRMGQTQMKKVSP